MRAKRPEVDLLVFDEPVSQLPPFPIQSTFSDDNPSPN